MRAFVTLGTVFRDVPSPRAWLFRVASNLWIDRVRRSHFESVEAEPKFGRALGDAVSAREASSVATHAGRFDDGSREIREAAGTLLVRLSPQERAAVVLRDVFDFAIDDIAQVLTTTEGAVKAALHRGRGKLQSTDETVAARGPTPGALDAFCDAFNVRDLERLTNLLLDSATVEIVGVVTEYGREAPKDPHTGSFAGTLAPITFDERGGVAPELLEGYLGDPPYAELRAYRDGWIVLFWYDHAEGRLVRTVMRMDLEGDAISHVSNYFFTPDVIAEVCTELGVPYRVNGYRYWPAGQ